MLFLRKLREGKKGLGHKPGNLNSKLALEIILTIFDSSLHLSFYFVNLRSSTGMTSLFLNLLLEEDRLFGCFIEQEGWGQSPQPALRVYTQYTE